MSTFGLFGSFGIAGAMSASESSMETMGLLQSALEVAPTGELLAAEVATEVLAKTAARRDADCVDYTSQFKEYEDRGRFDATDIDGDRCSFYASAEGECGNYDDDDFVANEMCCSCGGGSTYTGARSLAVNEASVFLSEGSSCPNGFEPIATLSACRASLDLLGISGMDFNGVEDEADWPKGCYHCQNSGDCSNGVWFNSHETGAPVEGVRRVCHRNFNAEDVKVVFVGDSDIDYWDSSVGFHGSFNVGVGGYTTRDVRKEMGHLVAELAPKWVVLVCGENDITGDRRATSKALERFKKIVTKFIENGARVIYLGTKVEPDSKDIYPEYMHYDAQIREFAVETSKGKTEPPFVMIDVFRSFTKDFRNGSPKGSWTQLYNSDGLHMSQLGYKLWNAWVKVAMESPTPCIRWSSANCVEAA